MPLWQTVELHKALADWGEGTSNASTDIGREAPATTNDATWLHRFFDSQEWNTPGGDFSSTVSVSTTVGATLGFYTWSSTPEMVADVQGWLDNPPGNFGWLVKGNESQTNTAKRFDTRENTTIANRPVLSIQFTSGVDTDAPAAPTNLVATAGDRQVVLDWDDNIELDLVGYNVYRSTTQGVQGAKITQSLVPGGASEYTDSGLPVGVEQFYMVTAVDESGNESDASSQVGATPFDGPPAAPTNLVARGGDRQVDLDWDDSPDPELAGYFVYRSLTSGGAYTRLTQSPITATQYLDTGLVALSVYRYVVTAVDAGGNESAVSTEASATTFPAPTPIPSISTAGMLVLALAGATAITWLTWRRRKPSLW